MPKITEEIILVFKAIRSYIFEFAYKLQGNKRQRILFIIASVLLLGYLACNEIYEPLLDEKELLDSALKAREAQMEQHNLLLQQLEEQRKINLQRQENLEFIKSNIKDFFGEKAHYFNGIVEYLSENNLSIYGITHYKNSDSLLVKLKGDFSQVMAFLAYIHTHTFIGLDSIKLLREKKTFALEVLISNKQIILD